MLSKWGQRFSPLSLFAAGEQGGWWDPSDFGTMFQDSAGTTPVTAVGQPVGLIRDKSGRGNHRTQGTAASRPTLQQDGSGFFYLSYDGVDDGMSTASVDFTGTDKVTVLVGERKNSDATQGIIVELSASSTANFGTFNVNVAPGGAAAYQARSRGTGDGVATTATTFAAPNSAVLSLSGDIANDIAILRVNGVQAASAATDQGTGNYLSAPIYFGGRGGATLPFNGREYQTLIRGAASSAAQIALAERFVGSKMGIVL